jgi:hypothetical protein
VHAEQAELASLEAGAPPLLLTSDVGVLRLSTAEPVGTFELCCPPDQLRPLVFEVRVTELLRRSAQPRQMAKIRQHALSTDSQHTPHAHIRSQVYLLHLFSLQPLPMWLSVSPTAAVLYPGGSLLVSVCVDAASQPSHATTGDAVVLCVRYSDHAASAAQAVHELHVRVELPG